MGSRPTAMNDAYACLAPDKGQDRKRQDDEGEDDGEPRDKEQTQSVDSAAHTVSDQNDAGEDAKTIGKTGAPERKGHENRHENAEGREAYDIPQDADHEGARWAQGGGPECLLELRGQVEERPASRRWSDFFSRSKWRFHLLMVCRLRLQRVAWSVPLGHADGWRPAVDSGKRRAVFLNDLARLRPHALPSVFRTIPRST